MADNTVPVAEMLIQTNSDISRLTELYKKFSGIIRSGKTDLADHKEELTQMADMFADWSDVLGERHKRYMSQLQSSSNTDENHQLEEVTEQ